MQNDIRLTRLNAANRLSLAIHALDAVRDLCCAAADNVDTNLCVNADHLACLLGLILGEMRSAEEDCLR